MSVEIDEERALDIRFEDESRIEVSLRPEDQSCPEALDFHGFRNGAWGFV